MESRSKYSKQWEKAPGQSAEVQGGVGRMHCTVHVFKCNFALPSEWCYTPIRTGAPVSPRQKQRSQTSLAQPDQAQRPFGRSDPAG